MKYKILNQFHPEVDREYIDRLQILYCGGDYIKKSAGRFIPKEEYESPPAHKNKLAWADYTPYFSHIVNTYAGGLLSKPFAVLPASDDADSKTPGDQLDDEGKSFWREFAENADGNGTPYNVVLKSIIATAMISKRAFLGTDYCKPDGYVKDKKQPYCFEIPPLSVIDWCKDDMGNYTWIMQNDIIIERKSIDSVRDIATFWWKAWKKEGDIVSYEIFSRNYPIQNGKITTPQDDDDIPSVEVGIVDFKFIPIPCLEFPDELWLGNTISNKCTTIFRSETCLNHAMGIHSNPILVYKQGSEVDGNKRSIKGTDPNRGSSARTDAKSHGASVIGPNDDLYFIEPDGKALSVMAQRIKDNVDELHRIVEASAQSVKATSGAKQNSAQSKSIDNEPKEILLSAFAAHVKAFVKEHYTLMSEARGEDIKWATFGMDDFHKIDREVLLEEATSINLISIPSKTFKKVNMQRIATEYEPSIGPQLQQTIKDEISDSIDGMDDEQLYPDLYPPADDGSGKPGSKQSKQTSKQEK